MAAQHDSTLRNLHNGVEGNGGPALPDYDAVEHELFHVAEYSVVCEYEHGQKVTLGVSPADTLYDLQQRFTAVTGIVPAERHLRFYFHDTPLSPAKSLSAQGIWDMSVISVRRKEKQPPGEEGADARQRTQVSADNEELPSYESITQASSAQGRDAESRRHTWQAAILFLIPYLAIFYALPISLIVIGAKESCEGDSRITSWMVVFGVCVLWLTVLALVLNALKLRQRRLGEDAEIVALRFGYFTEFQSVLQTFLGIWIICGSAWVYGCSHECRRKCNTTAFNLAFWTLTGVYMFITLIACAPIVTACLKRCLPSCRRSHGSSGRPSDPFSQEDLRRILAMLTEQAQAQEAEATQPQRQQQQQQRDAGAGSGGTSTVSNTGSSSSSSDSGSEGGDGAVLHGSSGRGSSTTAVVRVSNGVRGGREDDDDYDDDDDSESGRGRGRGGGGSSRRDDRSGAAATSATAGTRVTIHPDSSGFRTWEPTETLV